MDTCYAYPLFICQWVARRCRAEGVDLALRAPRPGSLGVDGLPVGSLQPGDVPFPVRPLPVRARAGLPGIGRQARDDRLQLAAGCLGFRAGGGQLRGGLRLGLACRALRGRLGTAALLATRSAWASARSRSA